MARAVVGARSEQETQTTGDGGEQARYAEAVPGRGRGEKPSNVTDDDTARSIVRRAQQAIALARADAEAAFVTEHTDEAEECDHGEAIEDEASGRTPRRLQG
jgi:hypothetical protein